LPATGALYSHFTGVRRLDEIVPSSQAPPYPVDDAAVHHVFEGGWIWVLRFNNGITSAGVAATAETAKALRLSEGRPGWERLLSRLPTVGEHFAEAKLHLPFVYVPRLSFRSSLAADNAWALLPSAAGFVDPLLSTGFPLTLLGITRLARLLEDDWNSTRLSVRLQAYSRQTLEDLDAAELMIAALYANMGDFSVFSALSLLYFAAASFTETARRLGRPELAGRTFLLGEHPQFRPRCRSCLELALKPLSVEEKKDLLAQIYQSIEPIDVAGLSDSTRRNWFAVDASDLLQAAAKLGAAESEIQELLVRCGFCNAAPISRS